MRVFLPVACTLLCSVAVTQVKLKVTALTPLSCALQPTTGAKIVQTLPKGSLIKSGLALSAKLPLPGANCEIRNTQLSTPTRAYFNLRQTVQAFGGNKVTQMSVGPHQYLFELSDPSATGSGTAVKVTISLAGSVIRPSWGELGSSAVDVFNDGSLDLQSGSVNRLVVPLVLGAKPVPFRLITDLAMSFSGFSFGMLAQEISFEVAPDVKAQVSIFPPCLGQSVPTGQFLAGVTFRGNVDLYGNNRDLPTVLVLSTTVSGARLPGTLCPLWPRLDLIVPFGRADRQDISLILPRGILLPSMIVQTVYLTPQGLGAGWAFYIKK